jgi:hypothetical protein
MDAKAKLKKKKKEEKAAMADLEAGVNVSEKTTGA